MSIRILSWIIRGGAFDVNLLDVALGIALTVGLFLFLLTHPAWSQPWPEKGRYRLDHSGISFFRENRKDETAPDWNAHWINITDIQIREKEQGLVIAVSTSTATHEVAADLLRIENCPEGVRSAQLPSETPAQFANRLVIKALWQFGQGSPITFTGNPNCQ